MNCMDCAKDECKDFAGLYQGLQEGATKARIKCAGEWYIKKALRYKRIFTCLSIVNIAAPLCVPSIAGTLKDAETATIILSAVASLSASLLTFSKCREKWTLYRQTVEMMKRELSLYWARKSGDEVLFELVQRLEAGMEMEQQEWVELIRKLEDADSDSDQKEEREKGEGND